MENIRSQSAAEQAMDVLLFMKRNVRHLALTSDLLNQDIQLWSDMSAQQRLLTFERQRRRFTAACPTLAAKDRVADAAERLRRVVG